MEDKFNERLKNMEKMMKNLMKLSNKETCEQVKNFGVDDGTYAIGKLKPPFEAKCVEEGIFTKTIVATNHDTFQEFHSCTDGLGCSKITVEYEAKDEELKDLTDTSEKCEQDIYFKCENSPLVIGDTKKAWWKDMNGMLLSRLAQMIS